MRSPRASTGSSSQGGQATVEFALVMCALLAIALALGALWRAVSGELFIEHALMSASHHVQAAAGWIIDVFSY